jgi:DNA-directed RNA polymerase subunit L
MSSEHTKVKVQIAQIGQDNNSHGANFHIEHETETLANLLYSSLKRDSDRIGFCPYKFKKEMSNQTEFSLRSCTQPCDVLLQEHVGLLVSELSSLQCQIGKMR